MARYDEDHNLAQPLPLIVRHDIAVAAGVLVHDPIDEQAYQCVPYRCHVARILFEVQVSQKFFPCGKDVARMNDYRFAAWSADRQAGCDVARLEALNESSTAAGNERPPFCVSLFESIVCCSYRYSHGHVPFFG